jgi:hypothetical protein
VQAVRGWVNDAAFWSRVRWYADRHGGDLDHDLSGMRNISVGTGHWHGQGQPCDPQWSWDLCGPDEGPGGSVLDTEAGIVGYFTGWDRTSLRSRFEREVVRVAAPASSGVLGAVPSSQQLQSSTNFVRTRVMRIDDFEGADGPFNGSDWFGNVTIAGQRFRTATIYGEDSFGFSRPNAPFASIKAVPRLATFPEPMHTLLVELRTSDVSNAGTDDDVYLRINSTTRFELAKAAYDDFERGDTEIYSVPIDQAFAAGLDVGDLDMIQIEKSPDGSYGGWKLGGVRVWANGRLVYANTAIERWLEDDARVWRATDLAPPATVYGRLLPISVALWDDDAGFTGDDDHGDLNPYASRKDVTVAYDHLGSGIDREFRAGSTYGYHGDGDPIRARIRIETIVPQPAAPQLVGVRRADP